MVLLDHLAEFRPPPQYQILDPLLYVTITSKLLEHVGLCRTLVLMVSQLL